MVAVPRDLIDIDAVIRDVIEIEPLPPSVGRLLSVLASPAWSLDEIIHTIQYDPVLAARLLRVANSAFFASQAPITDVRLAARRVGAMQLVAIAVGVAARAAVDQPLPAYGVTSRQLWRHSVAAAIAAEQTATLVRTQVARSDAFIASLLHDVGKVALARHITQKGLELVRKRAVDSDTHAAEAAVLSVEHAQLGAVIAKRWDLPPAIIAAIEHHHEPEKAEDHANLSRIVAIGDAVARKIGAGIPSDEDDPDATLDGLMIHVGMSVGALERVTARTLRQLDEVLSWYD